MKKLFLILVALLPSLLGMGKEGPDTISARRAFVEMPVGVVDLLTPTVREDMLIYFDNDSIYRAPNALNGTSFLETVTPDYLSVRLTDVSTLQLKVLPRKAGEEIVMAIYMVGAEGESSDSEIFFYDASMRPLGKEKIFPAPKLADFFDVKGYQTKMKEIEEMLPFYTVVFEASPGNTDLKGKLTYGDRLPIEDIKIIELFMKPEVVYRWNGKAFKPFK